MRTIVLTSLVVTAAAAHAQPAPDPSTTPPTPTSPDGTTQPPVDPTATPPTHPDGTTTPPPRNDSDRADPYAQTEPHRVIREKPDPKIDMPEVLTTPTGWLLPAAVLYTKTSLDTGGGVSNDTRVGLGDVAEFGVSTTDQVRAKVDSDDHPERIQPYLTASFRMGVAERRLFGAQPGITLGFRKSFERNHDGEKTRIAELTFVMSKHLGERTALHLGGAFWDASIQPTGGDEVTLHGGNDLKRQVRAFGGIQVQPIDKSEILIDIGWVPEFCYGCSDDRDKIRLRPQLSWGVRYQVADWMHLESGVRIPDIGTANLLDAQIFGSITFTSWALHHAVEALH